MGRVWPASFCGYSEGALEDEPGDGVDVYGSDLATQTHRFQEGWRRRLRRGPAPSVHVRRRHHGFCRGTTPSPGRSHGPNAVCPPSVSSFTFSTMRPLMRLRSIFLVTRPAIRSRMSLRSSASPGSRVAASCNQSGPGCRQGPTRRPNVQRGDVPVPHVLLMHRVQRDLLEGEGYLD